MISTLYPWGFTLLLPLSPLFSLLWLFPLPGPQGVFSTFSQSPLCLLLTL